MTDQHTAIVTKPDAPLGWGNRAEIGALADRFAVMLPNAKEMNKEELLTAAQYCRMMGLNPFRGEVYFYKSRGKLAVVDGYKALARWAQNKSKYSNWDEDLEIEAGQLEHVRVWILRDDRKAMIQEFKALGATFQEALRIAAHYADGTVTVADTLDRQGQPKDPPVGWTWRDVARKRAFKNVINLSHGAPSPREIAEMSWNVNGHKTRPEDWEGAEELTVAEAERLAELRASTRETLDAFNALPPDEQQKKAAENDRLLNGDPDFEGFDTPSTTSTPPPLFATVEGVIVETRNESAPKADKPQETNGKAKQASVKSQGWTNAAAALAHVTPYFMKGDQVDWYHLTGAAFKLGFGTITDENLDTVIDALRTYANQKEAENRQEVLL